MDKKAQAMVMGAFLGDSLALGAHWIYDTEKIETEIGRVDSLLAPVPDSYHKTKSAGDFTHYGDQSLHLLEYLAENRGSFDPAEYSYLWEKEFSAYTGYIDKATKVSLQNIDQGKDWQDCGSPSTDLAGPARIAPLIYSYRNDPGTLYEAVENYLNITHKGSGIKAGALFLAWSCHAILQGNLPKDAFDSAIENGIDDLDLDLRLRTSFELSNVEIEKAVKDFGQSCSINGALPGAIFTVLQLREDFRLAQQETVMAGGDSAARAMVVGMLVGAHGGYDALPDDWLAALAKRSQIEKALQRIG